MFGCICIFGCLDLNPRELLIVAIPRNDNMNPAIIIMTEIITAAINHDIQILKESVNPISSLPSGVTSPI